MNVDCRVRMIQNLYLIQSFQCSAFNAKCFWFNMIELFWKQVFFLMQKPIPVLSILRLFLLSSSLCRCFIAHKALTDLFTKWKHSMDTSNRKLNRFSPISCENFLIVYLSLFFFLFSRCGIYCDRMPTSVWHGCVFSSRCHRHQARDTIAIQNEIFRNSNSIVQFRKTYSRKFNYPHEKWAGRVRISLW